MNHGIVVIDKIFLQGITFWKTGKKDPKELSRHLGGKSEEYLNALNISPMKALSYLLNNTSLINNLKSSYPAISFHTFRVRNNEVDVPFFIGINQELYNNTDIFRKLPGHYALISELKPEIVPKLNDLVNLWLPTVFPKVIKCLTDMGLSDIPTYTYFAGEGGGPMSQNDPPLIYEKGSSKIE